MILTNKEDFQAIIPTATGIDFDKYLKTYVESAEDWLAVEILGRTLYNTIEQDQASHAVLVSHCRKVIAHKAYVDAIPFLDLVHTADGFGVVSTKNISPASKERVAKLLSATEKRRDQETELLFEYLEDTAAYHDEWKGATTFSILNDCLIRTAKELKLYGKFTGNREEFLDCKPTMKSLSLTVIAPEISENYLDELIEKQADGDLTASDKKVIELLKYVVAIMVTTGNHEQSHILLGQVVTYMDKHIEEFETYAASDEYAVKNTAGYENTADDSIFIGGMFP